MYRPMQTGTLITLALYFLLMIGIGLFAWKRSTDTSEGYMLAGRNLHPAVAALSAGASDMSGWLLLGVPRGIRWVGRELVTLLHYHFSCFSFCLL